MFTGIEHFAIASPDPQRLAEWYVAVLGFQIIYQYEGNFFVKAQNGAVIEIIQADGAGVTEGKRAPGLRHVAISVDDFRGAMEELQTKGVTMQGEPYENQGNLLVFFNDADGNLLHLIQRTQPLP